MLDSIRSLGQTDFNWTKLKSKSW